MLGPVIEVTDQYNALSAQIGLLDREIDHACSIIYFLDQQMRENIGHTADIAERKLKVLRKYLEIPPGKRDFEQLKTELHKEFTELVSRLTFNFKSLLSARDHYLEKGRAFPLTDEKRAEFGREYGSSLRERLEKSEMEFAKEEDSIDEWLIASLEEDFSKGQNVFIDLLDAKEPHTYQKIDLEEQQIKLFRQRRGLTSEKVDNIYIACQIGAIEYVREQCDAYIIANNRIKFLNTPDENGFCPLHYAAYHSHPEIVALLLGYRVDPDAPDKAGYRALHWAAKAGDLVSTRILLANKANVNAEGEYKRTPLHMAAFNHRPQVCELLLKGADPNAKADNGKTPLHDAVLHGDTVIAKELIKRENNDVTIEDDAGRTPLWYAVADGLVDLIPFIIAHPSWKNPDDESNINHIKQLTAMDIRYNEEEVRKILVEYFTITDPK